MAIDISESALQVAKQNAELNSLQDRIELKHFDIMKDDLNSLGKFDLIVSNPPYVSVNDFEFLEPELKVHEPRIALTDNSNGISFYKRIIEVSDQILDKHGKIYFELGMGQSMQVKNLFEQNGFKNILMTKDYSGIDRIICGELK